MRRGSVEIHVAQYFSWLVQADLLDRILKCIMNKGFTQTSLFSAGKQIGIVIVWAKTLAYSEIVFDLCHNIAGNRNDSVFAKLKKPVKMIFLRGSEVDGMDLNPLFQHQFGGKSAVQTSGEEPNSSNPCVCFGDVQFLAHDCDGL